MGCTSSRISRHNKNPPPTQEVKKDNGEVSVDDISIDDQTSENTPPAGTTTTNANNNIANNVSPQDNSRPRRMGGGAGVAGRVAVAMLVRNRVRNRRAGRR